MNGANLTEMIIRGPVRLLKQAFSADPDLFLVFLSRLGVVIIGGSFKAAPPIYRAVTGRK